MIKHKVSQSLLKYLSKPISKSRDKLIRPPVPRHISYLLAPAMSRNSARCSTAFGSLMPKITLVIDIVNPYYTHKTESKKLKN